MSHERPLHGGCACGRNTYIIEAPLGSHERARVIVDPGAGSIYPSTPLPLTAYLRVPLTWYHSTTYSFFPDETPSSIRRVFTPPSSPSTKRHFCGFCGTPLSFWTEAPREEAEFISLALGSLRGRDLRDLGDLGLLPEELVGSPRESPQGEVGGRGELGAQTVPGTDMTVRSGLPWFETMIEGSLLGRVRVRRGEEVKEGRKIEWEVVEWVDDGERSPRKRTIDDVEMEGKGKGV